MTWHGTDQMTSIETLLEEEKKALLAADFPNLPKILEMKEALIASFDRSEEVKSDVLERLQRKVAHNQVLLDEAMSAMRHAARYLSEARRNRRSVNTYTRMGQKHQLHSEANVSVEKKA